MGYFLFVLLTYSSPGKGWIRALARWWWRYGRDVSNRQVGSTTARKFFCFIHEWWGWHGWSSCSTWYGWQVCNFTIILIMVLFLAILNFFTIIFQLLCTSMPPEISSETGGDSARYEDHQNTLGRDSHGTRTSTTYSAVTKQLDVEELEMLLEAYFVQIDGTLNKLSTVCKFYLIHQFFRVGFFILSNYSHV